MPRLEETSTFKHLGLPLLRILLLVLEEHLHDPADIGRKCTSLVIRKPSQGHYRVRWAKFIKNKSLSAVPYSAAVSKPQSQLNLR